MPVESSITTSRYVYSINERGGLVRTDFGPWGDAAFTLRLGAFVYQLNDETTFIIDGPVVTMRNPVTGAMFNANVNDPEHTILEALFRGYNGFSQSIIIRDAQGRLSTNDRYFEYCYSWNLGDPVPSHVPISNEQLARLMDEEAMRRAHDYLAYLSSATANSPLYNPTMPQPAQRVDRNPNPKPPPRNKDWEWENE